MHEKSVTSSIKSRGRGESEWREVWRVNSDVVKRWRGHKSKRNTWFRKGTQAEQMRCLKGPTRNPIPFRNGFNNNIFPLFLTPHRFSTFCWITCGQCLFMSLFQTWRRLFSHVLSHSWSCKAATLEYGYLKSAVAWYGTFRANVIRIYDLVLTPTRHRVGFTFVVGDAVVKALRPVGRGGSVEGLHREGAGWRRLRPVLQRLFWRSKTKNHVVWRSQAGGSQSFATAWQKGLPSSWRRYWFPPRSLASDQASPSSLSQNSTTLFLSSCTQVPSELITCHKNGTLYPHSHTPDSRNQPSTHDTSQSVNSH